MRTGKTAAVIGASMSGLLTAAALHEHYDEVVVLDRDDLPAEPGPRKGVPQGRQLHALLGKGLDTMDELLPGLGEELLAAGAVPFDVVRDIRFSMDGRELAKAPSGIVNFGISRTLLEHHVRRRVRALPRVELREATPARGPAFAGDRVDGVETGGADDVLPADLVVDASGRGSRSLTRLREHGYPEPERTTVRADLVYVTRRYRTRPGGTDPARVVVTPHPGNRRGGVVVHEEDGIFCLVLFGMLGTAPPLDDAGTKAYAAELGSPDIERLLAEGEPLDEPVAMRYPRSERHHMERLDRLPAGLLLTGDALCSFNPAYGQGMTVAAMEARALGELLGESGDGDDLPQRFYARAARIVEGAWQTATGGDLRFPEVEGARPPGFGLVNRYLDRLRRAAAVDAALTRTLLEVSNLYAPPSALFAPRTGLRVLTARGLPGRA
ncbi:FAD-dependent oxidoreductase [Streptomyces sp. NPDC058426]|uniref:FAD-dependent oxidoreductase n=1 Tax=Streptomyces sp. NPDC058426 TaxID=3346493 RepID=UPI0036600488